MKFGYFIHACTLAIALFCWHATSTAWEMRTPLGIRVVASDKTIAQYNRHWTTYSPEIVTFPRRPGVFQHYVSYNIGPRWDTIDWSRVDEFFTVLAGKHGMSVNPRILTVKIKPLNYSCIDEVPYPDGYEFFSNGQGCIDGIVLMSSNEIGIHLGDDAGQAWEYSRTRSFCDTALAWELNNWFFLLAGNECWPDYSPACASRHPGIQELCN